MSVTAIGKAALSEVRRKFNKALFDSAQAQVMQAERLYTWAIDEMAVGIQVVQPCMGGGMFPRI